MSVFNMLASSFWEIYAVLIYFNAFYAYLLSIYSISLLFLILTLTHLNYQPNGDFFPEKISDPFKLLRPSGDIDSKIISDPVFY